MDEKTASIYAITKALAYQENGGKPKAPKTGKTGELKSIFQFEPDTWKKEAGKFLGDPNAPITPDNETTVVTKQVGQWIDKGYTVKQIASMWNAGVGEPDAYTGKFSTGKSSKGVNAKYNVPFDVPSYANNVANYAKQFYSQEFAPKIAQAQKSQQVQQPTPQTPTQPQQPPVTQQPTQSNPDQTLVGLLQHFNSPTS